MNTDNTKILMALLLTIGYGYLVSIKVTDASGLVVLVTYMIKKLMDMQEDNPTGGSNATITKKTITDISGGPVANIG